jgi:hypothetical protein
MFEANTVCGRFWNQIAVVRRAFSPAVAPAARQDSAIFTRLAEIHHAQLRWGAAPIRGGRRACVPTDDENTLVDLARVGWLATVLVCLVAVLILGLQGYFGYAGVTLAVALSAAINLR